MDIIGQNGNDGEHYEEEERLEIVKKTKEEEIEIDPGLRLTTRDGKERDLGKYLKNIMSKVKVEKREDDDLTKRY